MDLKKFQTKLLTVGSECGIQVDKVPQGTGSAQVQSEAGSDRDQNHNSPQNLTKAEKKALRIQVLHIQSGNTVSYSFFHIERLVKQGRAYVDSTGQTVIGIPPIEPENVLRHTVNGCANVIDRRVFRRNQPAVDLWPVLPHPAGRSIPDLLESLSRDPHR